jgi:DNA-binding NarL/FixJ family response regulator
MNPIRILLVDDHTVVRNGIKLLLSQVPEFAVVGEADNGAVALDVARETHPHVVLMDVTMPEMNGFEAAQQIREAMPDTKVLFLSMHNEPEYIIRSMKSGGSGYLLKSVEKNELARAIQAVYRGERYLSAEAASNLYDGLGGSEAKQNPAAESQSIVLTQREREVLELVANGMITKEIAEKLHLSPRTVETHRVNVMKKLKASNTAELIKLAAFYKLIEP